MGFSGISEGENALCHTLQGMSRSNAVTVHQPSELIITSNPDRLGLLSPTHGQRSQRQTGQITLQSILINKDKLLNATPHAETKRKLQYRGSGGEGLELVKVGAQASISPFKALCIPQKIPTNFGRSTFLVGPRRNETDHGQSLVFPSETSRFAPFLRTKGSALTWLVNDRAALRPGRI